MSTIPSPPTLLYANRTLRSTSNTANGEVSPATIFHYTQSPAHPHIVSATYSGGSIVQGHLIGTLPHLDDSAVSNASREEERNTLHMRYHHVNDKGELMTGKCVSRPEVLADGRLRLWERWEWTGGGVGKGESVVEEVVGGGVEWTEEGG